MFDDEGTPRIVTANLSRAQSARSVVLGSQRATPLRYSTSSSSLRPLILSTALGSNVPVYSSPLARGAAGYRRPRQRSATYPKVGSGLTISKPRPLVLVEEQYERQMASEYERPRAPPQIYDQGKALALVSELYGDRGSAEYERPRTPPSIHGQIKAI